MAAFRRTRLPLCGRSQGNRGAARYCAVFAGLIAAITRSETVLSAPGSEPAAIRSAGDGGDF
jgi:hypothetical protein